MKISVFYGKKCESTAGKKGYVISVNAGGGRLQCLVCADENEKEFVIDIDSVISVGDSIIYRDRESEIKASTPIRLGCAGYDERGKYLGNLQDFTFSGSKLLKAKIGKKNYPAEKLVCGDAILVKNTQKSSEKTPEKVKILKENVVKNGKILLSKGTPVTADTLESAISDGEYVQTTVKTL